MRNGQNWTQQAYLKASNTETGDYFGYSVAVSGDLVVVGADYEDGGATGVNGNQNDNSAAESGAAYVFTGLALIKGPSIVDQPSSQRIFSGDEATFTVSATTTNPPMRYQWRFNSADLPGAANDSLTILNAQSPTNGPGSYRVVVQNEAISPPGMVSPLVALTVVPPSLPNVSTLAPGSVTARAVTLRGNVNPNGASTTVWFEYGSSYGASTPAIAVGHGIDTVPFSATLTRLTPGTDYHYRAVATNLGGVVRGEDMTFQTAPALSPLVLVDPLGDFAPGTGWMDISRVVAGFSRENLFITVIFDPDTFLPPPGGYFTIFLDTDQDRTTGTPPPSPFAGADFRVAYNAITNDVGRALVINQVSRQTVGEVPFTFTTNSISLAVPLILLGVDDGVMDVAVRSAGRRRRCRN